VESILEDFKKKTLEKWYAEVGMKKKLENEQFERWMNLKKEWRSERIKEMKTEKEFRKKHVFVETSKMMVYFDKDEEKKMLEAEAIRRNPKKLILSEEDKEILGKF
jgi:hypothetical protein